MAEKGILIEDQTGGESVATFDVRLDDDDTNARVSQLVSDIPRPVVYDAFGTPLRTINGSDPNILDPLPAAIASGILDVSDASGFVFFIKVATTSFGSDTFVTITPVIVSEDATPRIVTALSPVRLHAIWPRYVAASTPDQDDVLCYSNNGSTNSVQLSTLCCQSTYGAESVAFHVGHTLGDGSITLFAHPVSSSIVQQEQARHAMENGGTLAFPDGFAAVGGGE